MKSIICGNPATYCKDLIPRVRQQFGELVHGLRTQNKCMTLEAIQLRVYLMVLV